jgi:hypothetical protein
MDFTNLDSFRSQIAQAQVSIQQLWSLRQTVDERIADLRDLVRANANFLPAEERRAELIALEMFKPPENIAEAVKITLYIAQARGVRVTPLETKAIAEERGFDFSGYTNPMASVHSILKRMKDSDPPEVDFDETSGTYAYLRQFPGGLGHEEFVARLNTLAWRKVLSEEKEVADRIAVSAVAQYFEEVTDKPKRSR